MVSEIHMDSYKKLTKLLHIIKAQINHFECDKLRTLIISLTTNFIDVNFLPENEFTTQLHDS